MDENKLIKLLEDKFPTKQEFGTVKQEFNEFRHEFNSLSRLVVAGFKEIHDKLDELTSSAKTLDKILESSPVERIDRLEKHVGLPVYIPTVSEE